MKEQMTMGKYWRRVWGLLWAYTGTLSALGLLIGVLGMGLYHLMSGKSAGTQDYRCFSGVFNSSRAEVPLGLGEMPAVVAESAGNHVRFEYDAAGRFTRLVHVDRHGSLCPMPGSKVAEQRLVYDAEGRVVRKSNYGANGQLVPDASGVAERCYTYNPQGLLTETRFYDAAGHNVVPPMPGYARERIAYDDKQRPICIEYLDGSGHPMVNARGECKVEYVYDDARGEVVRTNYVEGAPREDRMGVAEQRRHTSSDGSALRISWYDAEGKPTVNPRLGATAVQRDVIQRGRYARFRWCDDTGTMRGKGRVCAEHVVRYSAQGRPEWECYNAEDGMPCLNTALGYAERVCEYTPAGALSREYFWDADGNPTFCYEQRHHCEGANRHVLRLNTDGSTEWRRVH